MDKWFGFDRMEVLEEGMASYERGDYEIAVQAFETIEPKTVNSPVYGDLRLKLSEARNRVAQAFSLY